MILSKIMSSDVEEELEEELDNSFFEVPDFDDYVPPPKTVDSAIADSKHELMKQFGNSGSKMATERLIHELAHFSHLKTADTVECQEDNLFHWIVKLRDFPHGELDSREETQLWHDLQKTKSKCVELEVLFPNDFPFAPPFIRVLQPRFQFHTGHITIGGSICMEVLTNSGWVPSYSLETLLRSVATLIFYTDQEPRITNQYYGYR